MIKSSVFGSVTLSGPDAKKFQQQVRYGRPSQAAIETLRRGDELLQRFGGGVSEAPAAHTGAAKRDGIKLSVAPNRSKRSG